MRLVRVVTSTRSCFAMTEPATGSDAANIAMTARPDGDDFLCRGPEQSLRIRIGGCFATDNDFDGVSYQPNWPGSLRNAARDRRLHPRSVLFSSPTFNGGRNYDRVAFEADLPRIEAADYDVFSRVVSIPRPRRALIAAATWTRCGKEPIPPSPEKKNESRMTAPKSAIEAAASMS